MPPKKAKTRHSSGSCFGPACSLPDTGSLFTTRDVLAAVQMERNLNPVESMRLTVTKIASVVKVKWAETNPQLVLIDDYPLVTKITRLYEKALEINRNKLSVKAKNIFIDKLDKILDILVCQCPIAKCSKSDCNTAHCYGGAHITCSCLRQDKIPILELMFILDQRKKVGLNGGEMQMGRADKKEARRQEDQEQRKAKKLLEQQTPQANPGQTSSENVIEEENINMEVDTDQDFQVKTKSTTQQNRTEMTFYIAEVSRYGISDRAAAALYNAALKTVDIINDDYTKLVVDKSKIRRARDIYAAKQKDIRKRKLEEGGGLECLGSDGKRNKKTRVKEIQIINGEPKEKFCTKTREHIVYTEEPAGEYLCHSELSKGTGRDLCNDFMEVLAEHDSKESLLAVVADGTPTNTGWKEGMIAHLERDLGRPLLWLICQLHGNELPLRHLFDQCDGGFGTSGPDSFKGPIGQACTGELHLLDTVKFEKIETPLSDLDESVWKDLSQDQQLLYRWTKAIASGEVPQKLAGTVIGGINHSRWLTLGDRLEELYTVTPNPSPGLKRVVQYIVQVYAPSWFQIKANNKFTSGPVNLFMQMQLINNQPSDTQDVVKKVVQRNAYFAAPSVLLCSMLASDNDTARCKAVNLIKAARLKPPKPPKAKALRKIRKFEIPPLIWNADNWWEIIDWSKVKVVEPTILSKVSNEVLDEACTTPLTFPKFPCHSQSVERAVKLVTEAASKVCGGDKRHEHIVSVTACRKARKPFKSKKHYKYSNMDE